jgi:gamma-glutamylcyclotransferase (GGCT)/AIG2-like uncharacterized protein YtfP
MPNLFIYGSLQNNEVQMHLFGRLCPKEDATLEDYKMVDFLDNDNQIYPTIEKEKGSSVVGKLITLTEEELKKADNYEGGQYKRIEVTLVGGQRTWVYKT